MNNEEIPFLRNISAYHGGSWNQRRSSHQEDCKSKDCWGDFGANSEFMTLERIMLLQLSQPLPPRVEPESAQHIFPVDWLELNKEIRELKLIFEKHGIKVDSLHANWFGDFKPNLMFTRDLSFMTPWGAILSRMASQVRQGEEKWAQRALAEFGIPILTIIRGMGTFEGADALWLTPQSVLIGTGNRTNELGYRQVSNILSEFNVQTFDIKLPKSVQHLLGILQIISPRRALVRIELATPGLITALNEADIDIVPIPEIEETVFRQGMNVICVSPDRIIMPANCPNLKSIYLSHNINVLDEVCIEQLIRAAGGIACATMPLRRYLRDE